MVGFNLVPMACAQAGEAVLIQPPVYHPFYSIAPNTGRVIQEAPLTQSASGRYEIDFDLFERAITPETRSFCCAIPTIRSAGCSPGLSWRGWRRSACGTVVICSDEIHEDFVYEGHRHIPIATLGPEVAAQTVTLFAPSKSYNIAGFHLSVAHVSNPELAKRLNSASYGVIPKRPGVLDTVAGLAAYRDSNEWLEAMVAYLKANRDFLVDYARRHLPGVKASAPEGTYLAWLDCREAGIDGPPAAFFLGRPGGTERGSDVWQGSGGGFRTAQLRVPQIYPH